MSNKRKGYYISDQFGSYYLTFTIVGWVDVFARKECRDMLIDSMKYCQAKKGLIVHAYVIMSNHMHVIWRAREGSDGLSGIIRDFKKYTSKRIIKYILESKKESRRHWMQVVFKYHAKFNPYNLHFQVWKRDNRPYALLHPKFTLQKLNYIHKNPVAAGIVRSPEEYIYSSAGNYYYRMDNLIDLELIDYGVQEGYLGV